MKIQKLNTNYEKWKINVYPHTHLHHTHTKIQFTWMRTSNTKSYLAGNKSKSQFENSRRQVFMKMTDIQVDRKQSMEKHSPFHRNTEYAVLSDEQEVYIYSPFVGTGSERSSHSNRKWTVLSQEQEVNSPLTGTGSIKSDSYSQLMKSHHSLQLHLGDEFHTEQNTLVVTHGRCRTHTG